VPSFVRPFVGRTLHKSGGVLGAQVTSHIIEGLLRRLISVAGMATLAVIEDLDVFKDYSLGLGACFEALMVHQFLFQ